nr:ATP-binding cassette domain-containing protein [Burkholderiales bacterium]
IEFLEPEYKVDKLLSISEGVIGYENKILLEDVKLDIFQDSRIGLLGKNGIGKSTLIKAMINGSTLLNGELIIDKKIKIGYFAQHTVDQLDLTDTPFTWLAREHKDKKENELRSFLGRYGFSGDKIKEQIGNFSGGEKARLTIANIILSRPNILFLDEPTNHLDMQMREEIANSIQDFSGAVVIVSHDKFLLQSVVDEFYLLDKGHLNKFNGDLEEYHKILLAESSEQKTAKVKKEFNEKNILNKVDFTPKNIIKIKIEIEKIEKEMAILQDKINKAETIMATIDCKVPTGIREFEHISKEYNSNKLILDELESKWLSLQSEIE